MPYAINRIEVPEIKTLRKLPPKDIARTLEKFAKRCREILALGDTPKPERNSDMTDLLIALHTQKSQVIAVLALGFNLGKESVYTGDVIQALNLTQVGNSVFSPDNPTPKEAQINDVLLKFLRELEHGKIKPKDAERRFIELVRWSKGRINKMGVGMVTFMMLMELKKYIDTDDIFSRFQSEDIDTPPKRKK